MTDRTTPLYIDAMNLAYWCGNPPSLRVPLSALHALLQQGHSAVLVFDASARYRLAHEGPVYERLLALPALVLEVPSGRTADQALLKRATAEGARVLSRDKYRDHRKRYRKLIDDPQRLLTGGLIDGSLRVPSMGIDVPVFAHAEEAWTAVRKLLQAPCGD